MGLTLLTHILHAQNDSKCDEITFVDGKVIQVKVVKEGYPYIRFRYCRDITGTVVDTPAMKVFMIKYADNRLEIINTKPISNTKEVTRIRAKQDSINRIKEIKDSTRTSKRDAILNEMNGQLMINFGVGWSPLFNGQIDIGLGPYYPVAHNSGTIEYFGFADVIPNWGMTLDYKLNTRVCLGLASSYQSEVEYNYEPWRSSEKIERINAAARLLYFINANKYFIQFVGLRAGCSYWKDDILVAPAYYPFPGPYFLDSPEFIMPSFQFIYGIRTYSDNNFGAQFEFCIGSPYFLEGGITYRIKLKKAKEIGPVVK